MGDERIDNAEGRLEHLPVEACVLGRGEVGVTQRGERQGGEGVLGELESRVGLMIADERLRHTRDEGGMRESELLLARAVGGQPARCECD